MCFWVGKTFYSGAKRSNFNKINMRNSDIRKEVCFLHMNQKLNHMGSIKARLTNMCEFRSKSFSNERVSFIARELGSLHYEGSLIDSFAKRMINNWFICQERRKPSIFQFINALWKNITSNVLHHHWSFQEN